MIYDLSLEISNEAFVYPHDPRTIVHRIASLDAGDAYTLSTLFTCLHTGSHIDAPSHFWREGLSIDALSLETFYGDAIILDLQGVKRIDAVALLRAIDVQYPKPLPEKLIIKTGYIKRSAKEYNLQEQLGLTPDAVRLIVDLGIRLIGIDTFDIDIDEGYASHKAFAEAGIVILESICLEGVPAMKGLLIALPLCIKDAEASLTRAVFITSPCPSYSILH